MSVTFIGIINGNDYYNKIKIIIESMSDYDKTKYKNNIHSCMYNNTICVMCYVSVVNRHIEYYKEFAEINKHKRAKITITPKWYNFDGKKGVTFLLKYLDIIDIE